MITETIFSLRVIYMGSLCSQQDKGHFSRGQTERETSFSCTPFFRPLSRSFSFQIQMQAEVTEADFIRLLLFHVRAHKSEPLLFFLVSFLIL